MNREDWVLLAIYFGQERGLSPVQLQKCLFLLGQEMGREVGYFYEFYPHNYGPFSKEVYSDAELLESRGMIAIERDPNSYARYISTAVGQTRVRDVIAKQAPNRVQEYLANIVDWAQKQSFASLVRAIYDKYPQYRVNSVFQY